MAVNGKKKRLPMDIVSGCFFKRLVVLLLVFSMTVSVTGIADADPETLAGGIVRLEVYGANGELLGTGSGFAMGEPAVLVTAAHVIVNMEYLTAWRDDGSLFRIDRALDADMENDIAICLLPEDAGLIPLKAAAKLPGRGTDVTVISSQFGLTNLVTKGTLSGRWNSGNAEWLLFTAPVSGGSSGGPLFNDHSEVIGIVTGTYEKGQNMNLAAPIDRALDLMK